MSAPISQGVISRHPIHPGKSRLFLLQAHKANSSLISAWLASKLAHGSHSELVIDTTRVPGELFPVPPLVERLQQRDAAVDDRIGVEEERLEEEVHRPLETAPPPSHAPRLAARECTHAL